MRIIAGEARGRKLKSIKGSAVRPTLDRVKEAVFSMLGPLDWCRLGLDLFAGFGSLGLEALSRGVDRVIFVEKDYRNLKVIRENIELCGFTDRAGLKKRDVFTFLRAAASGDDLPRFELIMMDPPYGKGLAAEAVELIQKGGLLPTGGLLVVEHTVEEDPGEFRGLRKIKNRRYGDTEITIYQAEGGVNN